ncbi:unnamed protein product [Trypanosoma congolense IL3000]|uniref:WGS project CAEQ00000000 data, annotated contig 1177 n=1 Tax=Trypanosoma congolense (strain IL3000) TaxID=1068625 RepID=F9W4F6_TRYCI|nr:unnamed protein product [Trypanosoma congolense IL3000]
MGPEPCSISPLISSSGRQTSVLLRPHVQENNNNNTHLHQTAGDTASCASALALAPRCNGQHNSTGQHKTNRHASPFDGTQTQKWQSARGKNIKTIKFQIKTNEQQFPAIRKSNLLQCMPPWGNLKNNNNFSTKSIRRPGCFKPTFRFKHIFRGI